MKIEKFDINVVIESISRLDGRRKSHKDAAKSTNCRKKSDAHWSAYYDLSKIRELLLTGFQGKDRSAVKSNKYFKLSLDKKFNTNSGEIK